MSEQLAIPSKKGEVSEEEWQLRIDLAAAYRLIALYGWDDLIFTHLSVRIPGDEHHFLINPYGMMFEEITASSLVRIDQEGNKINPDDFDINPAGFTIHSAVHMGRDDAGAVMPLHAPDGVAVSAHRDGLLPLSQTAMLCLDHLCYHEYEGVALNLEERDRLIRDLGNRSMMILRNHGVLTAGKDVPETFTYLYFLMKACEIQVKAQSCGPTHLPSEQAIRTTAEQSQQLGRQLSRLLSNSHIFPADLFQVLRHDYYTFTCTL